jgi:import receptor subunit TOM20
VTLEKEKKKLQKEVKKQEEAVKSTAVQIIESVMHAAEQEPLPTTPEDKEKYFMEQVAAGESLCNRGKEIGSEKRETHYSVLSFIFDDD